MKPGVLLLVGTMKGAFLLDASPARARWKVRGPHFKGSPIYALAYDGRGGRRRIWAANQSPHWGTVLCWSDDLGESWTVPETANLKFPEDSGLALARVWQIQAGSGDRPDVLYAGAEPAALFESQDAGGSWSVVRGLLDHPHRTRWEPGGGGLCLHTILPGPTSADPLLVAISTGGVYRSDDGGRSWRPRNVGVRAQFLPDKYPEFGQCVHKVARHPSRPERLFLQNHWGLYRSNDWGDSWEDVANGVPSDFGFAMAVHPHERDTVYIVPLESDEFRCTPDARLRVYQTRDAGRSWKPLTRGLPQQGAYETVLRDALCTDSLDSAGVYFGTRSGKLFGSKNGGSSWRLLAEGLPPIVCVKAATLDGAGTGSRRSRVAVKRRRASGTRTKKRVRRAAEREPAKRAQRATRR